MNQYQEYQINNYDLIFIEHLKCIIYFYFSLLETKAKNLCYQII